MYVLFINSIDAFRYKKSFQKIRNDRIRFRQITTTIVNTFSRILTLLPYQNCCVHSLITNNVWTFICPRDGWVRLGWGITISWIESLYDSMRGNFPGAGVPARAMPFALGPSRIGGNRLRLLSISNLLLPHAPLLPEVLSLGGRCCCKWCSKNLIRESSFM